MKTSRTFLLLLLVGVIGCRQSVPPAPNIILVITDDQGWAQLGYRDHPVLNTPHLDRLAAESAEFTRFYASPVCAPTRASLMTGRYNYRTGVVDTYLGRAMMHPDEITLAEILRDAGYRTAIFGKWHLGDNYPLRATDQGFQKAVVHKGGGIGQPSDPPGNSYFDPILQRDNRPEKFTGYCTDIFFDQALAFIEAHRNDPFFVYLATNAPHAPYDVPEAYIEPYRSLGLDEREARIYGMIANIDENMGRLLERLRSLDVEQNTIVIFMTDNGPTTLHYTGGLRAQKGSVYEGGIRVPFLMRWPSRLQPSEIDRIAAHIDVLPTLLDAAGLEQGALSLDGISLLPLMRDPSASWPERSLFIQSHRGDVPQLYRAFAVVTQRFKLVQPLSFGEAPPPDAALQLYDLQIDPGEEKDLAATDPETVRRFRERYENWFAEVSSTRGYEPPRIYLGTPHENPVILTRQDWRVVGPDGWSDQHLGFWEVFVAASGRYRIRLQFGPSNESGEAELQIQDFSETLGFADGASELVFDSVPLSSGEARLEARLRYRDRTVGVRYVGVSGPAP